MGHDTSLTVLDVSALPSEVLTTVVGTLVRIVYDMLFWACDLPISGRKQPLLVLLEEAHLFLPDGHDSSAHRTISKIAKEGRKYGIGLGVVTQRPGEIDGTVLSQCGTMIALRLTNSHDRNKVEAAMPDDLGTSRVSCRHCELERVWSWVRRCQFPLEFSSSRLVSALSVMIRICQMHGSSRGHSRDTTGLPLTTGDIRPTSAERRRTMPEMVYVDSVSIEAVGYDGTRRSFTSSLFLAKHTFILTCLRMYFDAFVSAPSKGSFFNREIKPAYRFTKQ